VFSLAWAAVALLGVRTPLLSAALLSAAIFWRYVRLPAFRNAAIAQAVFVLQFVVTGWPFLALHNLVGRLDASAVRLWLNILGQDAVGFGTYLFLPSKSLAFDVMWGCASSTTILPIALAFIVVTLGLRGRMLRADLAWLLAIGAIGLVLNWLRLILICWSADGYRFWHEGQGALVFAALDAFVALSAAYLATRRTGALAASE